MYKLQQIEKRKSQKYSKKLEKFKIRLVFPSGSDFPPHTLMLNPLNVEYLQIFDLHKFCKFYINKNMNTNTKFYESYKFIKGNFNKCPQKIGKFEIILVFPIGPIAIFLSLFYLALLNLFWSKLTKFKTVKNSDLFFSYQCFFHTGIWGLEYTVFWNV